MSGTENVATNPGHGLSRREIPETRGESVHDDWKGIRVSRLFSFKVLKFR